MRTAGETVAMVVPAAEARQSLPRLPREEIAELHRLAMLGDMEKIQAWAARLKEEDQRYGDFAEKLSELAKGFKAKAIVALVEVQLAAESHDEKPQ